MKIPFFLSKKREKIISNNTNGIDSQKELEHDNLDTNEKEIILKILNQNDLQYFFSIYNLDKNSISLDFLKLLETNPNLLTYFINNFFEVEIIQKINNKSLRIRDLKKYDKVLFQYDIFAEEEKDLVNILRKKVSIEDKLYATFEFDNYINYINSNNFIDITVLSFLGDNLVTDRYKATPIREEMIFWDDKVNIVAPLEKEQIFSMNIFDNYYSGDLSLNSDNILFIPYNKFLEWSANKDKLDILKNVQVAIKDDIDELFYLLDKINISYQYGKSNMVAESDDKLVIKINHLLYLIENSDLNIEDKELFKYKVAEAFFESNKTFGIYMIEEQIKTIVLKLKDKLKEQNIKELTLKFNQLDKNIKFKKIDKPKFSVNLFLRQFDNFDDLSAFEFLNYVAKLSDENRTEVLSNNIVILKLQGLLKESAKDEYMYYEKFMNLLNIRDIFKIFDAQFIKNYYHNNHYQNEYRFFYTLVEKDTNMTLEYLLKDENYFEEFVKDISYYNFSKLNYPLLVQVIKKIEEMDLNVIFSIFGSVKNTDQFELLKEDFSNDMLVKIIPNLNKKVQQFFYLEDKRFNYLYDKFNIFDLIVSGVNDTIRMYKKWNIKMYNIVQV